MSEAAELDTQANFLAFAMAFVNWLIPFKMNICFYLSFREFD
jgi:hypothetical protein